MMPEPGKSPPVKVKKMPEAEPPPLALLLWLVGQPYNRLAGKLWS